VLELYVSLRQYHRCLRDDVGSLACAKAGPSSLKREGTRARPRLGGEGRVCPLEETAYLTYGTHAYEKKNRTVRFPDTGLMPDLEMESAALEEAIKLYDL
jgi:hypothetical protein